MHMIKKNQNLYSLMYSNYNMEKGDCKFITKRFLIIFLISIFLINIINAEVQSLPSQKIDNEVILKQIGADFVGCNITSISYPNTSTFISNVPMTKDGNEYDYVVGAGNISVLGYYVVNGYCTNLTDDVVWAYDIPVTNTGEKVSLSNIILPIILLLCGGICLVIAWSFSSEHWLLKTFFNFGAVGLGILSINSAKIIASESLNLGKVGNVGLTFMIVVFSLFFMYMFVYYFIETIKTLRAKGDVRWQYD